jgi:hypothetical protein
MIAIPYPGGQRAGPVAVEEAEANLRAPMGLGTEECGNLQLDQLLQAACGQLGNQLPSVLPSSSDARTQAPDSSMRLVRLVEVVLKRGTHECPSLAMSVMEPAS